MNIQAMMKQAQKLQTDMMNEKKKIDETIFEVTKSFISVSATGDKKLKAVKINLNEDEMKDKEMIEDMLVVALSELFDNIDMETEAKLGKLSKGMPGLY